MATKKKIVPAKDNHFAHVRSELKELGIVLNTSTYTLYHPTYYEVYPEAAKTMAVRKKLTIRRDDLYKAWEAGKELVALLASEYVKHLEHFEKKGKK